MTGSGTPLVGIEATALELHRRSGVSHYTAQLLHAMAERGSRWRFAVLSSRPAACSMPENVQIPDGLRFPNRSLWIQFAVPLMVARLKPRICHFTNSIAPLSLRCPFAVTLYDMSLFLFSELQPKRSLWLVRSILPAVARKAAAVITVSHSAKQDIIQVLKLPAEKVHVVHGAAAAAFHRIEDAAVLEAARRKYCLDMPYILAVSTVEPRKNLSRLVEAFCELRRHGRGEQLVLAGQFGWRYGPLLRQIETCGCKDVIRLLNYVPGEDLPAIYNLARAVAFPSLYEGFGLPIVEAMACGIPVLTSRRSAMAEIGEGAALLIDPLQTGEIAEGLYRLLTDNSLREELIRAGFKRTTQFSWDRAADETLAVYDKIAR